MGSRNIFPFLVDEQSADVETVIITPPSVVFRNSIGLGVYLVHKTGAGTIPDKKKFIIF